MAELRTRDVPLVTMLGCGLMGGALTRALAAHGCEVVVWNRTFHKAEALAGERIRAVRAVADALAEADLVVACVRDYRDLAAVLDGHALSGKILVNVSTGTAADAQVFAGRMRERGVRYLDGAVICYPSNVGTDRGTVLLSGDRTAWGECAAVLQAWGPGVEWLGDDPGLAGAVDSAVVGGFHITALLGFVESAHYAVERGVPPELLLRIANGMIVNFGDRMRSVVDALMSGDFSTDQAALATYSQALRGYLPGIEGEGYHVPLMRRSMVLLAEAEDRGRGQDHIAAVALAGLAAPKKE